MFVIDNLQKSVPDIKNNTIPFTQSTTADKKFIVIFNIPKETQSM